MNMAIYDRIHDIKVKLLKIKLFVAKRKHFHFRLTVLINSLFATFANLHVHKRATFADLHSYTHAYIVHSYCSMERLPLFLVRTVHMRY